MLKAISAFFSTKDEVKAKPKVEVTVSQKQHQKFIIDKSAPYVIYKAWPLITCSAYIINYRLKNGQEKVVLYHALAGNPVELPGIIDDIKKEEVELKNISIRIRTSDTKAGEPKKIIAIRNSIFDKIGFDKAQYTQFDIDYDYPSFSVDTHGRYDMIINEASPTLQASKKSMTLR